MCFFDLFEISSKSTWKYSRMELIGLENLKRGATYDFISKRCVQIIWQGTCVEGDYI
ncbi:hypothetical protein SLU01_25010 [Sporosarcina luteola]|uniref:Uncharacterized protein n=1 Tax=Sporosarcina luteola TaxID=582850 RepID=A0A511Z9Q6_9BACL|nr:hypothetical protein SLU01_25010 [Sporosarcina luteola]